MQLDLVGLSFEKVTLIPNLNNCFSLIDSRNFHYFRSSSRITWLVLRPITFSGYDKMIFCHLKKARRLCTETVSDSFISPEVLWITEISWFWGAISPQFTRKSENHFIVKKINRIVNRGFWNIINGQIT